ncbi:MAG TPA: GGDEF domain-containing protein [Gammaproteobacteria bacterium]|nr:GGDEF domain-containing protein [Gammaproteobacteria bacterium]
MQRHLADNTTLIRMTAVASVLLAVPRGVEQILLGAWTELQTGLYAATLASSVALLVLSFGPWFQRLYMPFAQVLVPLRNSLVAVVVAGVAARGQLEALMLLPLFVIGPFLVFGLRFRAAVFAVAITLVAYAATAVLVALPLPLILRTCTFLLIVAGGSGVVARTLERAARTRFLENHAMTELAQHDALTGLKNRRVFDEHLERLWQLAGQEGRPIGIVLIDVDHFKAYNDRYGHQAGDRALCQVARMLHVFVTRPLDLLARYGGEEFAVLLYDIDTLEAEQLAEQMRKAVCGLAIEHRGSRIGEIVTISAGVGVVEPSTKRRSRGALQLADEALYLAKTRGRNRVEVLDQGAHNVLETGVFALRSAPRG